MSQRESQFLWTWHCWTKCFVSHISRQRSTFIFKGPKNYRHFILNFRSCKIWPIYLIRDVGKGVPRDAVSNSRRTDALWMQLEDLKRTDFKETIKFTVVYFVIVVASPIINAAFIISRKNKFMQCGVMEQITTAAFLPPYSFVVWYFKKAISYLVSCIYVSQKKYFSKREKQNTNSNCFIS